MPWNGSAPNKTFGRSDGTRTGTQVWQQAEADGVDIVSTDHDTHDQDLASAINSALLKDGGNTATGNLPMGTYRHTNVGDALALTQYQTLKQSIANGGMYVAGVTGTADAIILTTTYTVPSLAAGYEFSFVVGSNNTGAATVVIDSNTAVDIVRPDGSDLEAGDLYAGAIAIIRHDGTQFQLLNRRVTDSGGGGGDMTGAEIVTALNVELGSDDWQESGISTAEVQYSDQDSRVIGFAKAMGGHGGGKWRVHWTASGQIVAYGDMAAFAYDPAGDNWGPFRIPVPWNTATVSIENIYCGNSYILVQTDESTGNLYHMGDSTYGQGGNASTTATKVLTRITKFTTDAVKISTVYTENNRGSAESAWFAITTGGALYSCGYSGAQHCMGYNSTTNLSTPRKMTLSDGTTALSSVSSVSFDTPYAPVWALLSTGTAYRWGAGTTGAHGNNSTSALTWPTVLETTVGSGVARTDISKISVSGASAGSLVKAVTWLLTTAGKIEAAGANDYGNGNGAALAATNQATFAVAIGAISSLTVSNIVSGGGSTPVCVAITSTGTGYFVGRNAGGILGTGSTTDQSTWIALGTLPTSFSGNLTNAKVAGGYNSTECHGIVLEATISGTKSLAAIGYDVSYNTGQNIASVAAASQRFALVQGFTGTLSSWQTVGEVQVWGIEALNQYGELQYCGGNDQGQGGVQFGNLHSVPIMQPCRPIGPRLLKPLTPKGAYSAGMAYSKNDLVTNSGSTWLYTNDTAAAGQALPTLPTTSNSYWSLIAGGSPNAATAVFSVDFDGLGTTIAADSEGFESVPFSCTITGVKLLSKETGSMVIDIQKDTYANYPPTGADSICSSTKPTLSSASKYSDTTLSGWVTSISAGDVLRFVVNSCSTITKAKLSITLQKT